MKRGRRSDSGTQLLDVPCGLRGLLHVGRKSSAASAAVHVEHDALVGDDEGFLGERAVGLCLDDDSRVEQEWRGYSFFFGGGIGCVQSVREEGGGQ